jgi:hypothetical protein
MITRALAEVLSGLIMVSCALDPPAEVTEIKGPEILYIHPDGTMIFRGRIMNEEDVIIYEDGRGGETVERKVVPVERK